MTGFPLIDSHQHVFWHGRDDAGLVADMDAHGIEQAWLLTWEEPAAQTADAHAHTVDPRHKTLAGGEATLPLSGVVEACRRYRGRFVAGYCPHPLDPYAVQKLSAAIDIWGVRVCGEWKCPMLLDDPRCIELFRLAGRRGCPSSCTSTFPFCRPGAALTWAPAAGLAGRSTT